MRRRTRRVRRHRWGVALAALALASQLLPEAGAQEPDQGPTIKGFGTVGLVRTDTDQAQFVRDLSQPYGATRDWTGRIDSLVGLQASMPLGAHTQGVIQAVSRYRYDDSYRPELTWAYLRHELSPAADLRVGRLGTEFYMLADSRLVGYAHLTVRPPADFYGPLVFSYFDGVDASIARQVGSGLLSAKAYAGLSPEKAPLIGTVAWDMEGSPLLGGHLDYLQGPWQLRLSHAQVRFHQDAPLNTLVGFDLLALAPEMRTAGRWVYFDSLGAVYDSGPLQLQALLSRIDHQAASYEDSRAGYLIAAYRLGPATPYLGYSRVSSTANAPSSPLPPPLHALVGRLMAQTHSDQHTVFLGARWDLRANVAVKAQLDVVRGRSASVFPVRESTESWNGRMTVLSLALDFLF